MGAIGMLFAMASLGLPGLGNFIAEFLILLGAFKANVLLTIIATIGLVFSAIYSLRIVQKVFLGPSERSDQISDFSFREIVVMAALTLSIVWLGLYPQPVINTVKPMINKLVYVFPTENKSVQKENYQATPLSTHKYLVKK
jgi:NADH-quinone oxidoreductase subunit M